MTKLIKFLSDKFLHLFFLYMQSQTSELMRHAFVFFSFRFSHLNNNARKVLLFDKLSIRCPNLMDYPTERDNVYPKDQLYENLFMVDKKGFDSCNATLGLKLLSCDNPDVPGRHVTVVFQPQSANENDPKFVEGEEYYFISKCLAVFNGLVDIFLDINKIYMNKFLGSDWLTRAMDFLVNTMQNQQNITQKGKLIKQMSHRIEGCDWLIKNRNTL